MRSDSVDVLIVGSGIAGLSTALSADSRSVTVLSAAAPLQSCASALAQGGIAAPVGTGDTIDSHVRDTLLAGSGLSAIHATQTLVSRARDAVSFLQSLGVTFDSNEHGLLLNREGGHSCARVLRCQGDATGAGILGVLLHAASSRPNIELRTGVQLLSLITEAGRVLGVTVYEPGRGVSAVYARDVVLATGGVGQLFRYTSNPLTAQGDGLAAALSAGAHTTALEFVQFHPTALLANCNPLPLITEALRGAGAKLIDGHGRRFMVGVHVDEELAPRDVVASAVWQQIVNGEEVFLDATHLGRERIENDFPTVTSICRTHGIDAATTPIPVMPAAHFHMGGVAADLDGRTSLRNLWCCGEVAHTGVHGANRLASNSLLEAVVCGELTGTALNRSATTAPRRVQPVNFGVYDAPPDGFDPIWLELRDLMWRHAGIVRTGFGLQTAIERVTTLQRLVPPGQIVLAQRLQLARAMLTAALNRRTTLGAHVRSDDRAA